MKNTFPHQDLLLEHKIDVITLSEKTKSLITKFEIETDEDKKEVLDERICNDIYDVIEAMEEKAKAEAKAQKYAAAKEKKQIDVSNVPTAVPPNNTKETGVIDWLFNKKQ